ncbi:MAG: biopolymer transporter ExbD [Fuerstiella sp.]
MRLPTRYNQRTPLKFNITPLIDVVFLLIIFFLVASHFVRSENAHAVELPIATDGEDEDQQAAHRLTITIDANGAYYIGGVAVDASAVLQRIEELQPAAAKAGQSPELRLRGHRSGRYGSLRRLIEHAARHQISSIRFAVDVKGD